MGYRAALLNFSKGEISPEAQARFDLPAYQAAAKRARNVKIKRTGGLYKRSGTRFVVEALSSASFPIPFQFSDEQAYVLEMAQQKMRPLALGGAVLEEGLTILSITTINETQAIIEAPYHGFVVGKQVYITGVGGTVEINDRFFTVRTVIDSSHFIIDFAINRATAFTADTGGITRTGPPSAPPAPPATPTPTPPPSDPVVGSGSSGSYSDGGTEPTDTGHGRYQGGGSVRGEKIP
jgi:hypothetical protein